MNGPLAAALACALVFGASYAAFQLAPGADADVEPFNAGESSAGGFAQLSQREAEARTAERPTWRVGDAWLVRFNEDFACWMVVGKTDADGYSQGTSCESSADYAAAQIASYDIAYVGRFTKDLASPKDAGEIRYFDWPLTDGKEWETEYYGEDVRVVAMFDEVDGPLGDEPGFELAMYFGDADSPFLRYNYVPSIRWWSELEFAEGGEVVIEDAARGWSGTVIVPEGAEERLRLERTPTSLVTVGGPTFDVPEEDTVLYLTMDSSFAFYEDITIRDPDGDERFAQSRQATSGQDGFSIGLIDDLEPGTWQVEDLHVTASEVVITIYGVQLDVVDL